MGPGLERQPADLEVRIRRSADNDDLGGCSREHSLDRLERLRDSVLLGHLVPGLGVEVAAGDDLNLGNHPAGRQMDAIGHTSQTHDSNTNTHWLMILSRVSGTSLPIVHS